MAIRIIDGVPGCGKTYFAVHHVLHSFFDHNKELERWIQRDSELILLHNIENFSVGVDLLAEIEKSPDGTIEGFFNYDYLATRFEGKRLVVVIDEAQTLFHTKYHCLSVFLYFQKHRHLGHDIYLVTQDAGLLVKSIRALAEYHISAVPRTMSLAGEFRYKFKDPTTGAAWRTQVLKRDGRIFSVYRSMVGKETEKIRSAPLKFMMYSVGLLLVCYFLFHYWVSERFFGGKPRGKVEASEKPVQNKPVGTVFRESPTAAVLPVAPDEIAYFAGVSEIAGVKQFIFELDGAWHRLSEDEAIRACRCHADLLRVGSFQRLDLVSRSRAGRAELAERGPSRGIVVTDKAIKR